MSFSVRLQADFLPVEPGSAQALSVEIENQSAERDTYEISLEGIDAGWVAIPVPTFSINPGEKQAEKIMVRPARESDSKAGSYPLVIKVRSLETGDVRTAQAILEVKAFHSVSVDINPKREIITPTKRTVGLVVTIMNLGNDEHDFQLLATDLDDSCVHRFSAERVTVGPGQQRSVDLEVTPSKRKLFAVSRLHSLTVTARSATHPTIMGASQCQIEQRALASPGALLAALFTTFLIVAWILTFPKPPKFDDLILDRPEIMLGESARIDWMTSNAQAVDILSNGQSFKRSFDPQGFVTYTPKSPGTFTISGIATKGDKISESRQLTLVVTAPPVVPLPRIERFSALNNSVALGEKIVLRYSVENVDRLTLGPMNTQLDPRLKEIEISAERAGSNTFTLIASNNKGESVQRTVNVTVIAKSRAKILSFKADPAEAVEAGTTVKLTWSILNGARAEISDGAGTNVVSSTDGTFEITPSETKTYKLIVYDADARTTSQSIKIEVKKPVVEPPTDPTTGGTPTGETSGTTGGVPSPANPTTGGTTAGGNR